MRTSRIAIASFVIGLYVVIAGLALALSRLLSAEILALVAVWPFVLVKSFEGLAIMYVLLGLAAIGLGIYALISVKGSAPVLNGKRLAIAGIVFGLAAFPIALNWLFF